MLSVNLISSIVAPCGSLPAGLTYGGNDERRILGSPSGDQTQAGRLLGRLHLSDTSSPSRIIFPVTKAEVSSEVN